MAKEINLKKISPNELIQKFEDSSDGFGIELHRKLHGGKVDLDWIFYSEKISWCYNQIKEQESYVIEAQSLGDNQRAELSLELVDFYYAVIEQLKIKHDQSMKFYKYVNDSKVIN